MKRNDDPRIVSLESHRRKKLADSRKRAAASRPTHERAINWRRAPIFIGAVALFLVLSWLLRGASDLFHLPH